MQKNSNSLFIPVIALLGLLAVAVLWWLPAGTPKPLYTDVAPVDGTNRPENPISAISTDPLPIPGGVSHGERTELDLPSGPDGRGPTGAAIRGSVVTTAGTPVANATVTLTERLSMDQPFMTYEETGLLQRTTTTLKDGSFSIRRLPIGKEFSLWVSHLSHAPTEGPLVRPLPEEEQQLPPLVLGDGFRVYGFIADAGGNPLQGAAIELRMQDTRFRPGTHAEWDEKDRAIGKLRTIQSQPDGSYEFLHLGSGIFTLTASLEGFATGRVMPVVLMGSNPDAEHNLELGTEFKLGGRVVDEQGTPIPEATVSVARSRPRPILSMEGASLEDGTFEVGGLPEGTYGVAVSCPGYSPMRMTRVQSGRMDLEFILGTRGGVTGKVTDSQGNPVPRFTLALRKVNPGTAMFGIPGRETRVQDEAGMYLFEDLERGTYRLLVTAAGFAPTYSPGFFVEQNIVRDVNITMTFGAELSGKVVSKDQQPLAGAEVILHGKDYSNQDRFSLFGATLGDPNNIPGTTVKTNAQGVFHLKNVYTGDLQLEIVHSEHLPEFIFLHLPEGGKKDIGTISMQAGGEISGTVTSKNGKVLAGSTVYLTRQGGGQFLSKQAVTDAMGRFLFQGLEPARYDLTAVSGKGGPFLFPSQNSGAKKSVSLQSGGFENITLQAQE